MAIKKPVKHVVCGDTIYAHTRKGELFLLSLVDRDLLTNSWLINAVGYLVSGYPKARCMHKVIGERMGIPVSIEIDHKNRIKTDVRRNNLRPATSRLNKLNRVSDKRNTSGIYGVHRDGPGWRGGIGKLRKWFKTKEEAFLYREALIKIELIKEIEVAKKLSDLSSD